MTEPKVTVTATQWEVRINHCLEFVTYHDPRWSDGPTYLVHRLGTRQPPWQFATQDDAVAFLVRQHKARMRVVAAQKSLQKVEAAA